MPLSIVQGTELKGQVKERATDVSVGNAVKGPMSQSRE